MRKPDWSSAPEWAEYLAMDSDGWWCWFLDEPKYNQNYGIWRNSGEMLVIEKKALTPFEIELAKVIAPTTLEKRP